MRRRAFERSLAIGLGVVGLLAVAAIVFLSHRTHAAPLFATVGSGGPPTDVAAFPASDRRTLAVAGVGDPIVKVGHAGGFVVYSGKRSDGRDCYFEGSLSAGSPRVGDVECPSANALAGDRSFPSRARPIVDFSSYALNGVTGARTVQVFLGVAADNVARVALVDAHRVRHVVLVDHNVFYSAKLAGIQPSKLIAMDRNGTIVYEDDR